MGRVFWGRMLWLGWWGGNGLIVLAWLHQVPRAVGWVGFAMALSALLAPVLLRRRWPKDAGPPSKQE
jgi:hypothetical protein